MNQTQAVKIAIECIRESVQKIAVDANLKDKYHLETPATINASERRKKLKEAIKVLESYQGNLL